MRLRLSILGPDACGWSARGGHCGPCCVRCVDGDGRLLREVGGAVVISVIVLGMCLGVEWSGIMVVKGAVVSGG